MLENRQYLELDEIDQIEGFTKYDLIDLFRRGKLKLYLWCSEPHLIAQIRFKGSEKPCTSGIFSYSGAVEIHKDYIDQLLNGTKTINIKRFIIKELDEVKNWTSKKPPKITYPNQEFDDHKFLEKPPEFSFYAFKNGEDSESKHKNILNSLELFQKNMTKFGQTQPDADYIQPFKDSMAKQVSITTKKFTESDIRFNKTEIQNLLNKNITRTKKTKHFKKPPTPIDLVILSLIEKRDLNSGEIWIELQKEVKKETFERSIDEYGILEEVSHERLYWRNAKGERKKLERSGFRKKVSSLKSAYLS